MTWKTFEETIRQGPNKTIKKEEEEEKKKKEKRKEE